MALFRIDLRLKPGPEGDKQLSGWPEEAFTPDFMVASSGLARLELESKVIGVSANSHQPTATTTDHLNAKQINYWLPDYTGGFALNLGKAALSLKNNTQRQATAHFIDEPMALHLEQEAQADPKAPAILKVSVVFNGESLTAAHVPAALVMAEIARCLQDFVVQLVSHNPRLADQSDVSQIRQFVGQLVV